MITIRERNRARLAVRLLDQQQEPDVGDHVLVWAKIEASADGGKFMASVTMRLREHAYGTQRFLVDRSDIVLATTERPE